MTGYKGIRRYTWRDEITDYVKTWGTVLLCVLFYFGMASFSHNYFKNGKDEICQIDRESYECKDWRYSDARPLSAIGAITWPAALPAVFAWRNPLLSAIVIPSGALLLVGLIGAGTKSREWYIVAQNTRKEKKIQEKKLLEEKMRVAEAKLRDLDPEFARELEEINV